MKRVLILLPLFALVACGPSAAQRKLAFEQHCVPAFNKAQCDVLFSLKESSDEADSHAIAAMAVSAASLGVSAGNRP